MNKAIFITGASSGIGFYCALAMAKQGYKVYAGCRSEQSIEILNATHDLIVPIKLDITSESDLALAKEIVERNITDFDSFSLFNNAGIGIGSPLELLSLSEFRQQLEVNVISQLAVTQALLPILRGVPDGRIIFNGSVSGIIPLPMAGAYGASKSALRAMVGSLRQELRLTSSIKVCMLETGSIDTEFRERSIQNAKYLYDRDNSTNKDKYAQMISILVCNIKKKGLSVEVFFEYLLHAIKSPRPKSCYKIGWDSKLAFLLQFAYKMGVIDFLIDRKFSPLSKNKNYI